MPGSVACQQNLQERMIRPGNEKPSLHCIPCRNILDGPSRCPTCMLTQPSPSRGPGLLCHGFISLVDSSPALSSSHHQAAKMSDDAWQAHFCSLSDARLLFGETHPVLPNLGMAALPLPLLLGGNVLGVEPTSAFLLPTEEHVTGQ